MNLTSRLYLVWRVRNTVSNPHPVAFMLRIRTGFSFAVRVQVTTQTKSSSKVDYSLSARN